MATFLLKESATSMLASKTNIMSFNKLIHKPLDLTTNSFTKSHSSFALTEVEYHALRDGLRTDAMPKHVAMFMDSHRRSAKASDFQSLKDITRICCELGIRVLSVYTCSSQNPPQSKEDVDFALNMTKSDLDELSRNDIRVSVIGNRNAISESLMKLIREVEESTKNNKTLHIIETVAYTGRFDIIQACKALAQKVKDGVLQPTEIDENVFQQELETNCLEFPNPDLMIRMGGKQSVGNFMLWQLAYSELCFVEKSACEFEKTDFIKALDVYQNRNRRFGDNKI